MARINGVDITEPRGSGGGGFTNALMGIFRDRSRAQQQLNLMAFGSALDVASKAAETEVVADVSRKALVKDFRTFNAKHTKDVLYPKGHPRAGEVKYKAGDYKHPELQKHVSEAGLEATPYGYRFSPSSLTKLEMARKGVGPFSEYGLAPTAGVKPTTGPAKPRGRRGSAPAQPEQPAATPMVNDTTTPVAPANVGQRAPKPTKGGFTQPALPGMSRAGATKAAKPKKAPKVAPTGGTSNIGMGEMPSA